jgi:site-specific DNA recombinase
MFGDPFYYGMFIWNNQVWQGKHRPMITIDEFERVQEILGKKTQKPKLKDNYFGYSGKNFLWRVWMYVYCRIQKEDY